VIRGQPQYPGAAYSIPPMTQATVQSDFLSDSVVSSPPTAAPSPLVTVEFVNHTTTSPEPPLRPGSSGEIITTQHASGSSARSPAAPAPAPAPDATALCPARSVSAVPSPAPSSGSAPISDYDVSPAPNAPPRTRLQDGIRKPKIYTDGTFHYAHSAISIEPYTLQEALSSPVWKAAMTDEYNAIMKNQTWA
jgi:hypothetical protein